MTKTRYLTVTVTVTVAVALLATATSMAQQRRQPAGAPPYDPAGEVTVPGRIVGTQVVPAPDAPQLVLSMTVEGGTMAVILGPAEWVQKQNFVFPAGATAEVVGLTGRQFNGNPAMSPRLVKVGEKTLTLRDATGRALWEQSGR